MADFNEALTMAPFQMVRSRIEAVIAGSLCPQCDRSEISRSKLQGEPLKGLAHPRGFQLLTFGDSVLLCSALALSSASPKTNKSL